MSPDDKTCASRSEGTKPVVWTAEDASRFLTSAIHEAQKPLAEALKQRPITSKALTMLIAVIIVAALAIALILSSQLEKTEKRADLALRARDEIMSEKVTLQAQSQAMEDRLNSLQSRHDELYGKVSDLKMNEERHRRAISELARFKQSNDILRDHISGLEQEKAALSTKLLKALSIEPGSEVELDKLVEEAGGEDGAAPDAPEARDAPDEPDKQPESIPPVDQSDEPNIGGAMAPPSVSEPEPVTEPEPAPEPEPTPEPEPVADAIAEPEPVVEPAEPTPEAIPEETETPEAAEEPAAEAVPEPAADTFQNTSEQYGEQLARDDAAQAEEPAVESGPDTAANEAGTGVPNANQSAIDAAVKAMDKDLDAIREQHEALTEERPNALDESAEAASAYPEAYEPEEPGSFARHVEAVIADIEKPEEQAGESAIQEEVEVVADETASGDAVAAPEAAPETVAPEAAVEESEPPASADNQ
jgi:hypothetical protein